MSGYRVAASRIAKLTLTTIPLRLPAAENARQVIKIASGEEFSFVSQWAAPPEEENLLETQSKLFSLTYHVLGMAQRHERGFSQIPGLWPALQALREALYYDLIRTLLKRTGCADLVGVNSICTPTRDPNDDSKAEAVVEFLASRSGKVTFRRLRKSHKSKPGRRRGGEQVHGYDQGAERADVQGVRWGDMVMQAKSSGLATRHGSAWLKPAVLQAALGEKSKLDNREQDRLGITVSSDEELVPPSKKPRCF